MAIESETSTGEKKGASQSAGIVEDGSAGLTVSKAGGDGVAEL
jgi:hypothetical protein